jgi:uncharacterized membrane protein
MGALGLGLIMVYVNYEFAFQSTRLMVGKRVVLGLGLILVYVYYEFSFQRTRLRVG